MLEIGLDVPPSGLAYALDEALAVARRGRVPGRSCRPTFILGGGGTGIAARRRRAARASPRTASRRARSPRSSLEQSVAGWKEYELEVMRDHADNVRRRLLDRELRPDGRAHRRLDHRGSRPDPDRRGVPADARRRVRLHPPDRRRHRRIEHPVRGEPRRRRDGRHRDEPARVALERAGEQGDRVPDREDRGQARGRLPPRRDPRTTSPGRRRRASSRPSTTSSPRSRAGRSRSCPARRRCSAR